MYVLKYPFQGEYGILFNQQVIIFAKLRNGLVAKTKWKIIVLYIEVKMLHVILGNV